MALTPIGELSYELYCLNVERRRALRESRAGSAPATRRWRQLAARYDRLLCQAAQMLDVPVPRLLRQSHVLGPRERAELERALAEAGLYVSQDVARKVAG